MSKIPSKFEKKDFVLSVSDATRICEALEFSATWDKTEVYYKLKNWIEGKDNV
jgi:hypothetical protein